MDAGTQLGNGPRAVATLVGAVVAGAAIRIACLANCDIDHFDEGVYAATAPADELGRTAYPLRHLYAPPLVPGLQALTAWITGETPWAPLLLALIAGCATPMAIGWAGSRWFNPLAGAIAATLAATSDLHAAFSRSALTDVPLLLFLVLALIALEAAFRRGRSQPILLAGVMTGVCWWTKYNGWLPLAIGATALLLKTAAGGLAARRLAARRSRATIADAAPREPSTLGNSSALPADPPASVEPPEVPAWGAGLAVAAIAGIAFASQIYFLSADGYRYAEIAANHRRYVVGPAGWFESLRHQIANLAWFEGVLTTVAGPLWACVCLFPRSRGLLAAIALSAGGLIFGTFPALLVAAAIWLMLVTRTVWRSPGQLTWGTCLLIAWTVGLFVATPNYTPYARLSLPLVAALWLVAGDLLARMAASAPLRQPAPDASRPRAPRPRWAAVALRFAVPVLWVASFTAGWSPLWQQGIPAWCDRTDLRRVSSRLVDRVLMDANDDIMANASAESPRAVFLTYGEPAVFHLLTQDARFRGPTKLAIAPTGDIPRAVTLNCPVFLIAGPHAGDDAPLRAAANRLTLVAEEIFQLSDLPLLDLRDARQLDRSAPARSAFLRCYRLRR
jgi:hypothetical protein